MKGQRVFILLLSVILLYSIRHGQLGGTRSCQGSVTISSPAAAQLEMMHFFVANASNG